MHSADDDSGRAKGGGAPPTPPEIAAATVSAPKEKSISLSTLYLNLAKLLLEDRAWVGSDGVLSRLKSLGTTIRRPKILISYAWTEVDMKGHRRKIQVFLQCLQVLLNQAGFDEVLLDITHNIDGSVLKYMRDHFGKVSSETLEHHDLKILIACTPTLVEKSHDGTSSVCHELDYIQRIRELAIGHRLDPSKTIIPLWLDGTKTTGLPTTFMGHLNILFGPGCYLEHELQKLLFRLSGLDSPSHPEFKSCFDGIDYFASLSLPLSTGASSGDSPALNSAFLPARDLNDIRRQEIELAIAKQFSDSPSSI